MSKTYPECPLYNHENCKELHNSKLCAIVRKDKACLRKFSKTRGKAQSDVKIVIRRRKDNQDKRINLPKKR